MHIAPVCDTLASLTPSFKPEYKSVQSLRVGDLIGDFAGTGFELYLITDQTMPHWWVITCVGSTERGFYDRTGQVFGMGPTTKRYHISVVSTSE